MNAKSFINLEIEEMRNFCSTPEWQEVFGPYKIFLDLKTERIKTKHIVEPVFSKKEWDLAIKEMKKKK